MSRGVLRSYRQGIKRARLHRRDEIESLLRVAPSAGARGRGRPRRAERLADIPLAESWIRD